MSAIDSNSRHLKNAWAWIGLAFAVIVIVLFSTPCIVAHYAVPGRDSEGNDIMVYSTQAYFVASLLWRSRVFAFMDFLIPLLFASLLVVSLLALFLKTNELIESKLTMAVEIIFCVSFFVFLLTGLFTLASIPTK